MKKYVVKFIESGNEKEEYASKEEAEDMLMWYIRCNNRSLESNDAYISRFDFIIEEVEKSVADLISDFESARRYLKLEGPNKRNITPLIAIDQLFTIAEAWNKADGFVPDFSGFEQKKWYPWFKYDKDTAEFVCADTTYNAPTAAGASIGSRLCFKTRERAAQFGKQFADLYNKVLL